MSADAFIKAAEKSATEYAERIGGDSICRANYLIGILCVELHDQFNSMKEIKEQLQLTQIEIGFLKSH